MWTPYREPSPARPTRYRGSAILVAPALNNLGTSALHLRGMSATCPQPFGCRLGLDLPSLCGRALRAFVVCPYHLGHGGSVAGDDVPGERPAHGEQAIVADHAVR